MNENKFNNKIDKEELENFKDYFSLKTGFEIHKNRDVKVLNFLLERIKINTNNSMLEYLELLDNNDEEMDILINKIIIKETLFLRTPKLFEGFSEIIRNNYIENNTFNIQDKLSILSVGCSTGEEIYSIIFMLNNLSEDIDYSITAIDINKKNLKKVKEAKYKKQSLRNLSKEFKDKYFAKDNEYYYVNEVFKKEINLIHQNLLNFKSLKNLGKFEIIFFKNVLIYLKKEVRIKIIDILYEMLNENGYLILEETESVFGLNNKFKLRTFNGVNFYKK